MMNHAVRLRWSLWAAILMLSLASWAQAVEPLTAAEREQATQLNSVFRRATEQVIDATVFIHVSKERGFSMAEGLGSGVIIDEQGYVVTNDHVVKDTDRVEIMLSDGRRFEADEIMLDPDTDLAVVHFDPQGEDIPAAHFGNSDALQVGDFVIAIGSPFGLEQTVTVGTVSFMGRRTNILDSRWGYEDFIQTDAAINKGNSGGPLVNLYGEVIGINSNILSPTGVSAGYGFAIPSRLAKFVVGELMDHKVVRRGYLGVNMHQMTVKELKQMPERLLGEIPQPGLSDFLQELPDDVDGVIIIEVNDGTPAAEAGIEAFDIITALDGKTMSSSKELRNRIAMLPPETKVRFGIWRKGETKEITVELADRNAAKKRDMQANAERNPFGPGQNPFEMIPRPSKPKLGVSVKVVDDELAEQFGFEAGTSGVMIIQVLPGTMAQEHGLKAGEIVRQVNDEEITSVEQLKGIVSKVDWDQDGLKMELESPDSSRTVYLKRGPD